MRGLVCVFLIMEIFLALCYSIMLIKIIYRRTLAHMIKG
nr:MAG TPA: Rer1 family protein [Bacteriophage sp.]